MSAAASAASELPAEIWGRVAPFLSREHFPLALNARREFMPAREVFQNVYSLTLSNGYGWRRVKMLNEAVLVECLRARCTIRLLAIASRTTLVAVRTWLRNPLPPSAADTADRAAALHSEGQLHDQDGTQ